MKVVKRMWQYINANELKNPSDKRIINCDDTLRELFGVESINMFAMNKALTKHIWPLDSDAGIGHFSLFFFFPSLFSWFADTFSKTFYDT